MAIKKLTFDGALNTAKTDADLNYFLTGYKNGIVHGIGGNCEATSSGGKISFRDGYVSAYGRRAYIEDGTSISISLTEIKYGYVVLGLNTSTNEATLYLKEGTSSAYPSIQQDNLQESEGLYEVVLTAYYKTTSSLALNATNVQYIKDGRSELEDAVSAIDARIGKIQSGMRSTAIPYSSQSDKTVKFDVSDFLDDNHPLITFRIGYTCVSMTMLSLRQSSSAAFFYNYYDSAFSTGSLEISGSYLYVTLAESTHRLKKIYISY